MKLIPYMPSIMCISASAYIAINSGSAWIWVTFLIVGLLLYHAAGEP